MVKRCSRTDSTSGWRSVWSSLHRRAFFCQPKTRGLLFFNGEPCILLNGTNRTDAGAGASACSGISGRLIASSDEGDGA